MHMLEAKVRQTLSGYVAAAGGGNRFGVNLTLIIVGGPAEKDRLFGLKVTLPGN